ncbi:MAG: neutral/alkaline non-lysosomal ceramidase N-terminal domain-containing protein [Abditibacteriaceae bacterium]
MINIQAGVARIELKPPFHLDLSGFAARNRPSTGTHDPLFARALALSDGGQTSIILAVDTLGFEAVFVKEARHFIEVQTGVAAANIMFCATHTHGAPASMFLRGCGEISSGWIAQLLQNLAQAVLEAVGALAPARILAGSIAVRGASANRIQLDDPIDYALDILRLDSEEKSLSALFSFGCHPTGAGPDLLISADFPGVLLREIETRTGAIGLYCNGASGDINPLLPGTTNAWGEGSYERVEAISAQLTGAALDIWPRLEPLESSEIKIVSHQLELPLQMPLSEIELKQLCDESLTQMRMAAQVGEQSRSASATFEWAMQLREAIKRNDVARSVSIELQLIRIGEIAIVGIPGEVFAALGLAIKRGARSRNTFVLGTTNGNIGYIGARAAYGKLKYELGEAHRYYGYPAALSPEAGEIVVGAACEMINLRKD